VISQETATEPPGFFIIVIILLLKSCFQTQNESNPEHYGFM